MNYLTLHAYEDNGELFLFRCPECGSTGEKGTQRLAHEPPLAILPVSRGPERRPVRVPEVGEEPRCTLEQVREDAVPADLPGFIEHVLKDRFDSDGNQQPQGGDAVDAGGKGIASPDRGDVAEGDSVQCGGVALARIARVNPKKPQGMGEWPDEFVTRVARLPREQQEALAKGPRPESEKCRVCDVLRWPGYSYGGYGPGWEDHEDANWLLNWHGIDPVRCGSIYTAALFLTQQQSSSGQEEGVTQKDFDRAEQLIAEGKFPGGQEGDVEE